MKKKTVTLGYVVFVTISAMLGAGCDANGEKAMAKAINLFKEGETIEGFKLAQKTPMTNPELQYHIATSYYGSVHNYAEEIKWLTKSAEQGYVDAQERLGLMYLSRNLSRKTINIPSAIKWLEMAAKARGKEISAEHQYTICKCYLYGDGTERDVVKAVEWFKKAEAQKPPADTLRPSDFKKIADAFLETKDSENAIKWYTRAATAKNKKMMPMTDAMIALYDLYSKGEVVPKNEDEALKWLKMAADAGDPDAKTKHTAMMQEREAIARKRDAIAKKDTPAQDGKEFYAILKELPAGEMREQYCKLNRELLIANLRGVLDGSFMKAHSSFMSIDSGWEGFIIIKNWQDGFILDDSGWYEVMDGVPLKKMNSCFWLPARRHIKRVELPEGSTTPTLRQKISISVRKSGENLWQDFIKELNGKKPTSLKLEQFSTRHNGDFVAISNAEIFDVSSRRVLAWAQLPNNEDRICVQLTDVEKSNDFDVSDEFLKDILLYTDWSDLEEEQKGYFFGYVKNGRLSGDRIEIEGRVFVRKK